MADDGIFSWLLGPLPIWMLLLLAVLPAVVARVRGRHMVPWCLYGQELVALLRVIRRRVVRQNRVARPDEMPRALPCIRCLPGRTGLISLKSIGPLAC